MNSDLFEDLKTSLRQMKAIESGTLQPSRVFNQNEVSQARAELKLTQTEMATLLGTPLSTLRGWEQGRRKPHKTARILLRLAKEKPDLVMRTAREFETV